MDIFNNTETSGIINSFLYPKKTEKKRAFGVRLPLTKSRNYQINDLFHSLEINEINLFFLGKNNFHNYRAFFPQKTASQQNRIHFR